MAFELQYFPEYRLILIRVSGTVSLEENRAIGLQLAETLEAVATTVDTFFDLRALEHFPTSIRELRRTSAIIQSPKLAWIVLLTGDKPLLKFVATVLIQLQTRSGRIRVFDTLDHTISFLQELQPTAKARADWLASLRKSLN